MYSSGMRTRLLLHAWRRSLVRVPSLVVVLCLAALSHAGEPHPLVLLPPDKLLALAPLLRQSEVALLESEPNGEMKQITVLSLSSAPPSVVHDVVAHPENYADFVRNMDISEVRRLPSGGFEHTYQFSYKVVTMDGIHRYMLHPGPAGPIELFDALPASNGLRHYRWEFLPCGAGTLIVMYGFTDLVNSSGVVAQLRSRFPTLDFGMGLIAQMSPVLAMKARAEQLSGGSRPVQVSGSGDYGFLLGRGTMAIMRTAAGRLSELSLISNSSARPELLTRAAQEVPSWSQYVPSIKDSHAVGSRDGLAMVELTQQLPLLSFTTRFGVQPGPTSVDLFGFSGDQSSARMRFDIRGFPDGHSQLIFRSTQRLDSASFVLRQLYKLEPLFEYGVNVGLAILVERGIRNYAENLSRPK